MKYKRILLKLSGEALKNGKVDELYDYGTVDAITSAIVKTAETGVEVAIVVGAGNIWRGARPGRGMDRVTADQMGMLGTVINALSLKDALAKQGKEAVVMTSVAMKPFAEPFSRDDAVRFLSEGKIVIFGCGTGSPYFSTDTGAVLKGKEIEADALLFAKNVDGIYDSDPNKNPNAKRYTHITFAQILKDQLKAIDMTAAAFGMDNDLKILVFGLDDPDRIAAVAMGEEPGTVIDNCAK